jgi:hypothetical protein
MARFALGRDIRFFEGISRELVDAVVTTAVVLYKLIIEDSKTNLYGESLSKTYYQGVNCNAMIQREDSQANYEGFGSDTSQNIEFRFDRYMLEEKESYPEIGDVIYFDNSYYEIDNVNESQFIGGNPFLTDDLENDFSRNMSVICSTVMVRKSDLNIEERIK